MALPEDEVRVLQVAFVDVQQGDGALVQTPSGKLVTIDGGENQLFAGSFGGGSAAPRLQRAGVSTPWW